MVALFICSHSHLFQVLCFRPVTTYGNSVEASFLCVATHCRSVSQSNGLQTGANPRAIGCRSAGSDTWCGIPAARQKALPTWRPLQQSYNVHPLLEDTGALDRFSPIGCPCEGWPLGGDPGLQWPWEWRRWAHLPPLPRPLAPQIPSSQQYRNLES